MPTPFDDFRFLLDNLPSADRAKAERVRAGLAGAAMPAPAQELAAWLAGWSGGQAPAARPVVAIFAGNHGVAKRAFPEESDAATAEFAQSCSNGTAPVSRICAAAGLGLKVFDLALELPTADITVAAAMDERTCAATMAFGMEAIVGGADLVCVSDLGHGGEIAAAAVAGALGGREAADPAAADWPQPQRACVETALAFHAGQLGDPFEALRRLGGRELAAAVGAMLAARMERIPVILDGYATTAAASVLHALDPAALEHCRLACLSGQPGHGALAARLGLAPLLAEPYGAGAVGGALAVNLVKTIAPLADPAR